MIFKEIKGNLITLAKVGEFDAIAHGCNCFSTMGAGIAVAMAREFGADMFPKELVGTPVEKLGNIDYKYVKLNNPVNNLGLDVINAYTQYRPGRDARYSALVNCFDKINIVFKDKHLGLPWIGAGIGGLDINKVRWYINEKLPLLKKVTLVEFDNS